MFKHSIPSSQIVSKIAKNNRDYSAEFANTETNNDMYEVKIFLRRNEDQYKIRLVLVSGILAYPALDMSWVFTEDEYEMASRVYHRICDEIDEVKTEYDRSMMPVSTVSAKIRESVGPISISHREKTNMLPLDESMRLSGVSDWRFSLYGGHYPNLTQKEKSEQQKFEGNQTEYVIKRTVSKGRSGSEVKDISQ